MSETTDLLRELLVQEINAHPGSREVLEATYGKVWDTKELQEDYAVIGFAAPFAVVIRKSDNVKGTLCFQHNPRFYFAFVEDKERTHVS